MIRTILFDLGEVLIDGLIGIERLLPDQIKASGQDVISAFLGEPLNELCCGRLSEETYLSQILRERGWPLSVAALKGFIRTNFRRRVPGMEEILVDLAEARYDLVLVSDHAPEWVEYVRSVHPFLQRFAAQFFSFEVGTMKADPTTFRAVLRTIERTPEECLFIDDREVNVRSAESVGIGSILFRDARSLGKELQRRGILDGGPGSERNLSCA
jgi:2-haloacid dehalogenase